MAKSIHEERLEAIVEMIGNAQKQDMLLSTRNLLDAIVNVANGEEIVTKRQPLAPHRVVISCDASIKVNPGGPSSVGVVIQVPEKDNLEFARMSKATTNNQAEYEAVYVGLTTLMGLNNNPGCTIEVRSDSQLVIRQLKGEMVCNDKTLQNKRDAILELVAALPVPVEFIWRPRNSTEELKKANYLAQDLLEVPRH